MTIPAAPARRATDRLLAWQRAFMAASVVWAVVLPLAPLAATRPRHGVALFSFAYAAYAIGSVICHQIDARSFHLWSAPLPVCARCTGIYIGAAIAALTMPRLPPLAPVPAQARTVLFRRVLVAAVLPTIATVVFEWTTGHMPANLVRALAGAPIGAAVAWIVREVN